MRFLQREVGVWRIVEIEYTVGSCGDLGDVIGKLRQSLRSGDADGNRIISLHELSSYVGKEVAAMVSRVKRRQQNPVLVNDGLGDVAIYVLD